MKSSPPQTNNSDLVYIAGLFDGEGCVECKQRPVLRKDRKGHPTYNQWYIRVEMTSTSEETIRWVYDTLGFGWWREKKYNVLVADLDGEDIVDIKKLD